MGRFRFSGGARALRSLKRFRKLPRPCRRIVFYAEDAWAWEHFAPMVRHLCGPLAQDVCYLTSSSQDPLLQRRDPRLKSFYIGSSTVRTILFTTLRADLVVMTMPDLESFHIKRSAVHPVHYVYAFHSLVSTHMVYRPAAFDAFDTVLCAGPHHVREIRAREHAAGLTPKELVEHGYGLLDGRLRRGSAGSVPERNCVLLAPSWGSHGLLETCGPQVLRVLLDAGWQVIIRPHPRTLQQRPDLLKWLEGLSRSTPRVSVDREPASAAAFARSAVMISDWSGAALEFAFSCERPVLFLDLPRKVNNPGFASLGTEPLEVAIRDQIGCVMPAGELSELPVRLRRLLLRSADYRDRLRRLRQEHVFHVGRSGEVAAEQLSGLAARLREQSACAV